MLFFVTISKIGSLLIYFLTANKNYQENLILITNTYDFMMVSECENQQALGSFILALNRFCISICVLLYKEV